MEKVAFYVEANEVLRNAELSAGDFEEESPPFRSRTRLEIDGAERARRRKLESPLSRYMATAEKAHASLPVMMTTR